MHVYKWIATFMNISAALLADSACFIAASFSAYWVINQWKLFSFNRVIGSWIEECFAFKSISMQMRFMDLRCRYAY